MLPVPDRISLELLHEKAALWFINDSFGAKIMIKAPSNVIKSILNGCGIEFLFGIDRRKNPPVLHSGLKIFDDPVHYLTIVGTERFMDEHDSMISIMNRSYTSVHFHDEMNACVATANIWFSLKDQLSVINLMGHKELLYVGDFTDSIQESLNCFEYTVNPSRTFSAPVYEIDVLALKGEMRDWQIVHNSFVGIATHNAINISDIDEGATLERQIFTVLESIFGYDVVRNPQIKKSGRIRELTDIFAFSSYSNFLIETKAIGINEQFVEKSMNRKVTGLQKQINKGVDQLIGAYKQFHSQPVIYSPDGTNLEFNKVDFPHCIVLVSELLPFGDWKEVEFKILKAMVENKFYLNVIDFKQFMQYVGLCQGNPERLNLLMIERVENFIEHKSIHMAVNIIQ